MDGFFWGYQGACLLYHETKGSNVEQRLVWDEVEFKKNFNLKKIRLSEVWSERKKRRSVSFELLDTLGLRGETEGSTRTLKKHLQNMENASEIQEVLTALWAVEQEEENVGISVFAAHHPNAQFTDSTPHGVRLANAIGRFAKLEGSVSAEELATLLQEAENVSVKVEKTDKGILWSIV